MVCVWFETSQSAFRLEAVLKKQQIIKTRIQKYKTQKGLFTFRKFHAKIWNHNWINYRPIMFQKRLQNRGFRDVCLGAYSDSLLVLFQTNAGNAEPARFLNFISDDDVSKKW